MWRHRLRPPLFFLSVCLSVCLIFALFFNLPKSYFVNLKGFYSTRRISLVVTVTYCTFRRSFWWPHVAKGDMSTGDISLLLSPSSSSPLSISFPQERRWLWITGHKEVGLLWVVNWSSPYKERGIRPARTKGLILNLEGGRGGGGGDWPYNHDFTVCQTISCKGNVILNIMIRQPTADSRQPTADTDIQRPTLHQHIADTLPTHSRHL